MIVLRKKIATIIIVWLFVSSLLIAILYGLFNPEINLLILKDLFIVATLALLVVNYKVLKWHKFNIYVVSLLLYLLFHFFASNAPVFAKLASVRQVLIPFLLIYLGICTQIEQKDLVFFKKNIIKIAVIVILFGYFEVVFSIWHSFELGNYFKAKNIPVYGNPKEPFYNYPPFFIEPIFGGIKRMTATILDPINLGHTLVFIVSILYYDKSLRYGTYKRIFLITFFLIALFLTFSKGSLLQLVLVGLLNFTMISRGVKILIMFFLTLLLFYMSNFHLGIKIHLSGIKNAINSITLLGHGIAKTGNQAKMFFEQSVHIGDTFIGAIIGQIGIIGLVLWIIPFYVIYQKIKINIVGKILLAQLIISIISENAFNLLSIFLLCITTGIIYRLKINE